MSNMVAQVVFLEPPQFYLSTIVHRYPRLEHFYRKGKLYMDIRTMCRPLLIQTLNGHPDSEFALLAGERKNYIIASRLNLQVVTPAYSYTSPLEVIAEKEVSQLRKEFGGDKKVALYIDHQFKGLL